MGRNLFGWTGSRLIRRGGDRVPETSTTTVVPPPRSSFVPVRRGDRGRAVAEIRSRLVLLALSRSDPPPDGDADDLPREPPGDLAASPDPLLYDEALDRAVRAFQQLRGLTVDG